MRIWGFFAALLALSGAGLAQPAAAQASPFAPQVIVNDGVVTVWEVEQRRRFYEVLGLPGDAAREAVERLIEDRLRLQAAQQLGIRASEADIADGIAEFAGRANLSPEEFTAALAEEGVAPETLRAFVEAGVVWREVVRTRFASRVQVTEAEIDRALALTSRQGGARVLLSELILPATEEYVAETGPLAERLSGSIRSEAEFAEAARRFSVARTREAGGRLDWMPLANVPADVAPVLLSLAPGQVTPPIRLGNVIALFLLRGIDEGVPAAPEAIAVDYAQFLIPGGASAEARAEAERIAARLDRCDDLYGVAKGLPEERLIRETRAQSELPPDIALELARLDDNEVSVELVRGDARVLLMLCGRTAAMAEGPSREEIRTRLLNQRIAAYAEGYLAELRADAHIVFP